MMRQYMEQCLIFFLINAVSSTAFAAKAGWTSYQSLLGYGEIRIYKGPGKVSNIKMGGGCVLNVQTQEGEEFSSGSEYNILRIYVEQPEGYRDHYRLGCVRGEEIKVMRKYYTTPEGVAGLSQGYLDRLKEMPNLNTHAVFFNGKNWEGIGITEDYIAGEYPMREMEFCLFGAKQALCGTTTIQSLRSPKERSFFSEITAIFKRIEFVDNALEENYVVAPVANEE